MGGGMNMGGGGANGLGGCCEVAGGGAPGGGGGAPGGGGGWLGTCRERERESAATSRGWRSTCAACWGLLAAAGRCP
jgi:hypothetical protein